MNDIVNSMARMRDAERALNEEDRRRVASIRAHAQRIVERDLHVSDTTRKAMRHVVSRLKHGMRTYRTQERVVRRALWQGARAGVEANRALYRIATGGI
jgi:hypothetical protein